MMPDYSLYNQEVQYKQKSNKEKEKKALQYLTTSQLKGSEPEWAIPILNAGNCPNCIKMP